MDETASSKMMMFYRRVIGKLLGCSRELFEPRTQEGDTLMKRLLLVAVLLVASAAPALAEEFANPYSCLVADKCR